tara:strand:- start:1244 stop:2413 length:1170 start_codon:yes stop_codon:yes gene_type:complete
MSKKKKVLLRAPVLTMSGYGVHSRQVARWLLGRNDVSLTIQAVPWGITPWMLNADTQDGFVGKMMECCSDFQGPFDVSFQVQLPNEWDPKAATHNVGITAAVETDRCNPDWVNAVNLMDAVIVPSTHTLKCLESSGNINTPTFVIPEAFPDVISQDTVPEISIDLNTEFNFLLFGQITGNNPMNDRKNIFNTIKWFCEVFKGNEDVGLIVKTNSGKSTKIDRVVTLNLMKELLGAVRKGPFPRIHFLHGSMSDDDIAGLYRHPKIKCLLTLTRGEGFGLPILEAAASGLPVIATNWSGHLDFMNLGKFIKIEHTLVDVHESRCDDNIFMRNAKWAEPVESDVKRKIEKFYNRVAIPTEWAQELSATLRKTHSFESISEHYSECMSRFLG